MVAGVEGVGEVVESEVDGHLVVPGFGEEHGDSFNLPLSAASISEAFLGWVEESVSLHYGLESVIDDGGVDLVGCCE